jgi:CHASE1-domain containing sensor protein
MSGEQWTALNSLLMPLIMLLSLMVSTTIAVLVYRFTRRQSQMEALRLINSRWQELNKTIIDKPMVQRLVGDPRFAKKSDDEIVTYNFLFQVLNVTYEIHFAAKQGIIDASLAERFTVGNADILRHSKEQVLEMLSWNRGYDAAFCGEMRRLLGAASEVQ